MNVDLDEAYTADFGQWGNSSPPVSQIPLNAGNTGGTIRISSRTGSFAGISDSSNTITVTPSESISGQITLQADDLGPASDITPLIVTPSWGNPQSNWQLINSSIPTGQSTQNAIVSLTAPTTPGVYTLEFAFEWEKTGDQVASATNWAVGQDVWGDGNDIATLNQSQIQEGQQKGYTEDNWYFTTGYAHQYVPFDAITIVVGSNPNLAAPANLQATQGTLANEVELNWTAVNGATYQIWRNTTNNTTTATELKSGITSTTFDDASPSPGTNYYWVVAANGSQTSYFSSVASGYAGGPSGSGPTVILNPLELVGSFSAGTASGEIQIGLVPSAGQTFSPLLTVDGSVSYNKSDISINGTVTADIESLALPLLDGTFDIAIGQADSSPGTMDDSNPNATEGIAGLPIDITKLSLIPVGGSVAVPEIEVQGNISLPDPIDTTINADLVIGSQGLKLESGSITFPNVSFALAGLNIEATQMELQYDSTDNQFLIQGNLSLVDLIGGTSATADLAGNDNGITIQGQNISLAGALSLNDLTLPGGFGLKSATLTFDTAEDDFSGSANVSIPDVFDLSATFKVVHGQLDDFSIDASDINEPILDTGWFLQGVGGGLDNLISGPVTFDGTLTFTLGPDVQLDLPSWLGGGSTDTAAATLTLNASISATDIGGSATLAFVDNIATITGTADINFASHAFTANGSVTLADGVYTGTGNITDSNDDFVLTASGSAQIPFNDITPLLPDVSLATAGLYLNYDTNLAASNNFLDLWGSISLPIVGEVTKGVRVGFDGSVSIVNANDLPQVDPPASATFTVAADAPWIMLGAMWTNSNSNVPFEIVAPDGTTYTQSNLPSSIGLIAETTNSTQLTVGVQNPEMGNWSLVLPDTDGLGSVSFLGLGGTLSSGTNLNFIESPANGTAGSAFASVVAIEDQNGNVVIGDDSEVTLTLTGGPGDVNTILTAQAQNGIAVFSEAAPDLLGSYTLEATDGSDPAAKATFAVVPAETETLKFIQQPTDTVAGQAVAPAITVQAMDQFGNLVAGDNINLNVLNGSDPTPFLTLSAKTDDNGIATFSGLSLTTAGTYTLIASDGEASTGNSSTFTISPAGAYVVAFVQQPGGTSIGSAISPSPVVYVEDQFGNLVASDNSTVILSATMGPGSLNGTTTVQAKNGIATFDSVSLGEAGIYSLNATDGDLISANSAQFMISSATPTVSMVVPPPSIVSDGTTDVDNWAIGTVNGVDGAAIPTGVETVVFYSGASTGNMLLTSPPIGAGTFTVVANYAGDANYSAAQSNPVAFTIAAANSAHWFSPLNHPMALSDRRCQRSW